MSRRIQVGIARGGRVLEKEEVRLYCTTHIWTNLITVSYKHIYAHGQKRSAHVEGFFFDIRDEHSIYEFLCTYGKSVPAVSP